LAYFPGIDILCIWSWPWASGFV